MRDINKELEELRETLPKNVEIRRVFSSQINFWKGHNYVNLSLIVDNKAIISEIATHGHDGENYAEICWNKFLLEYAKIAHTLYKEEEYEDGEYYWVTLLDGSEPRIMWFFQGEWFSECGKFTFKSVHKVISKIERPESPEK